MEPLQSCAKAWLRSVVCALCLSSNALKNESSQGFKAHFLRRRGAAACTKRDAMDPDDAGVGDSLDDDHVVRRRAPSVSHFDSPAKQPFSLNTEVCVHPAL
jgi:hypothetical protein